MKRVTGVRVGGRQGADLGIGACVLGDELVVEGDVGRGSIRGRGSEGVGAEQFVRTAAAILKLELPTASDQRRACGIRRLRRSDRVARVE